MSDDKVDSKAIIQLIKDVLREEGFASSKQMFARAINGMTVTLQMQKSPSSTRTNLQFWLDLAIYGTESRKPREEELLKSNTCLLRKRIGYLRGNDALVYEVDADTNVNALRAELRAHVQQVVAFVAQFATVLDFVDHLERENVRLGRNAHSFLVAITLAQLGHLERAKKFFLESEGDKAAITSWAKRWGIDLASA